MQIRDFSVEHTEPQGLVMGDAGDGDILVGPLANPTE